MTESTPNRKSWKKKSALATFILLVTLQLVPYGRAHDNPPVSGEHHWDSEQTRRLFQRACADCHSHQTVWPWYSHVAPANWLVQHNVDEGRREFNVSTWDVSQKHSEDAAEMVRQKEMPPDVYLSLHPEAKLTPEETEALITGLVATFGDDADGHH